MKKVLLAVSVIAMLGMVSCNKEKTCHCVYDYTLLGSSAQIDLGDFTTEGKCSDLEDNTNFNIGSITSGTVTCTKK